MNDGNFICDLHPELPAVLLVGGGNGVDQEFTPRLAAIGIEYLGADRAH